MHRLYEILGYASPDERKAQAAARDLVISYLPEMGSHTDRIARLRQAMVAVRAAWPPVLWLAVGTGLVLLRESPIVNSSLVEVSLTLCILAVGGLLLGVISILALQAVRIPFAYFDWREYLVRHQRAGTIPMTEPGLDHPTGARGPARRSTDG